MGFTSNSSDKAVVADYTLYTGLAKAKVLAINPTKEEAESLGISIDKEPPYTGKNKYGDYGYVTVVLGTEGEVPVLDDNGNEVIKEGKVVTRHMKKIVKQNFFIGDGDFESNKNPGSFQWVNKKGRFTWAKSLQDIKNDPSRSFFETAGARKAKRGEETLTKFLIAWLNVDQNNPKSSAQFDSIDKMAKGDFTEMKDMLKAKNEDGTPISENKLQVLLTVNRDQGRNWQAIYTSFFGRASSKDKSVWTRNLQDSYSSLEDGHSIQGSLRLQEYFQPDDIAGVGAPKSSGSSDAPAPATTGGSEQYQNDMF